MRLNQFEIIVALEACESLSEVAEKLYITQPSISKAMKELEDEVGYAILKRTKSGVVFTELGMQVLQYAKEILERVERIKHLQIVVDERVKGTIALGVTRFWGSDIFSCVVMGLKEQYPNLSIQFHEGYSNDIIKDVQNHVLDIGVIMMYSTDQKAALQMIAQTELQYEMLFADVVGLYAAKNHKLHRKCNLTMAEVIAYPYVTGGSTVVAEYSKQLLQSYGYQREIEIINNQHLLLQYLRTQEAFTSMPEQIYAENIEYQKNLKAISVQDLHWNCQVGVVYRPNDENLLESIVLDRLREKLHDSGE